MCTRLTAAILVAAGLLSACGGGGDGSAVKPFTAFSDIQPGETVQASGLSQSVSATVDASANVTDRTVNPVDTAGSSVRLTYDAGPTLTGIRITTPQSTVAWSGSQISCSSGVCAAANDGAVGAVIDAFAFAWNYQTFGYWLADTGPTSGVAGVISMGNPTPVSGIPASGTAIYNGLSGGTYVDSGGVAFSYAAVMSANANFNTRTIGFTTSGTNIAPLFVPGGVTPNSDLNLAGTLSIATGANQFAGTVNTAGPTVNLTGTATGRFYGPAVEEIGGVFALTGTGVQSLVGGFGGKK